MTTPAPDTTPTIHLESYRAHRRRTWGRFGGLLGLALTGAVLVVALVELALPGPAVVAWAVGLASVIAAFACVAGSLTFAYKQARELDAVNLELAAAHHILALHELELEGSDEALVAEIHRSWRREP